MSVGTVGIMSPSYYDCFMVILSSVVVHRCCLIIIRLAFMYLSSVITSTSSHKSHLFIANTFIYFLLL